MVKLIRRDLLLIIANWQAIIFILLGIGIYFISFLISTKLYTSIDR